MDSKKVSEQTESLINDIPDVKIKTISDKGIERFSYDNTIVRNFAYVKMHLGALLKRSGYNSLFCIGILNGLLPCGLVYLGIAGAINTGSAVYGAGFMAAFGLGTVPAMLL